MTQDQSNSLEGEFLAKLKVTNGLKLHNSRVGEMHCSSDSYESDSESFKSDSPYYRNAAKSLPSSTQKWTSTMLESLGIDYNDDFHKSPMDILNMITEDTGIFGALTEQQNLYVEDMKNSMMFDCSIQDFIEIMQKKNMFTVLDHEIANIKDSRLESTLKDGSTSQITNTATSESLLLKTYDIKLPEQSNQICLENVDEVSANILRGFAPAVLETRTPIETIGDGNCLYRSVSTGLFGTQIYHHHLRLLTALEIINNKQQYDTSSKGYTDRIRDNRVVTSPYEQLVRNAIVIGAYSDMQHMYGLSAVINKPLQSYYPPLVSSNYHTEPYHRKIVGRTVNECEEAAVTIMWTMKVRPQPFAVFDPNHFVPLLRLHTPTSQFVDLDDSSDQDHTSNQRNAKNNKCNKEGTNQDYETSIDPHNRDNSSQQHNKDSDTVDSTDATYNNERKKVLYTSLVEDFIRSVKMMLTHYFNFYTKSIRCPAFHNPVPKDRFVHIFRTFAQICNLIVEPGSAWKGEMVFGKSHVVSAADLVLLPDNSDSALSVVMVVTVFEAKSSKSLHFKSTTEDQNGKKKPKMSSKDSASSDLELNIQQKPAIYSKIPQNILAQHVVELLIHHPYYRKELNLTKHELHYMNYLPGMIVIGTEVVLTLLKIDDFHVADLKKNGFSVKRKATIYYSEPKDLLKKIDRDLLFDSFAKLCNI